MKIKLVRKQKYTIETHQEVEVDINDLIKYNNELEELDELFYDSPETIMSGGEQTPFTHPDNFDYVGNDILIWDERDIDLSNLTNLTKDEMEYITNKYGSVREAYNFASQYVRLHSYKNQLLDELPNWECVNITSIKEYIRDKKIEKLLNK